jgi:signal transduction histidine kinase
MFNLLRNADTHTETGSIAVQTQAVWKDGSGYVKVTVSDTGTGIAPSLLPRVFERGVHGEGQSDGYGLAICKDIITAYGGEIYIESGGGGTSAIFTLPVYPEAEGGAVNGSK